MDIIFTPPVAFALLLISSLATLRFLKRTFAPKGTDSERKGEAYACGQRNMPDHVKPNYSAFLAYAFLFTVMHVLVLLIALAHYPDRDHHLRYVPGSEKGGRGRCIRKPLTN